MHPTSLIGPLGVMIHASLFNLRRNSNRGQGSFVVIVDPPAIRSTVHISMPKRSRSERRASMRLPFFTLALMIAIVQTSAAPVSGQTTSGPSATPTPVRNILANAGLQSVVDAPLHFKL